MTKLIIILTYNIKQVKDYLTQYLFFYNDIWVKERRGPICSSKGIPEKWLRTSMPAHSLQSAPIAMMVRSSIAVETTTDMEIIVS